MSYAHKNAYFEQLARKNNLLAHGRVQPGTGDERCSYFRMNDNLEVLAAQVERMHMPCLLHMGYGVKPINKGGSERLMLTNQLWVLYQPDDSTAVAIADAYEEAETVVQQLVAYMLHDFEENGACGAFRQLDASSFSWQALQGPELDNLYGFELTIREEQSAANITLYDPSTFS